MKSKTLLRNLITVALLLFLVFGAVTWLRRDTELMAVRNVVLISIDTCRADYFGCYDYPLTTTPNIDALADEGVTTPEVFGLATDLLGPPPAGVRKEWKIGMRLRRFAGGGLARPGRFTRLKRHGINSTEHFRWRFRGSPLAASNGGKTLVSMPAGVRSGVKPSK